MKKVYVVTDGERIFMVCKNKSDAEDLVKLWGRDYTYSFIEVPYMDTQEGSAISSYPMYRDNDVEPMPFIGKPVTANKSTGPTPVPCREKNTLFPARVIYKTEE